jgi:hypothetical protein
MTAPTRREPHGVALWGPSAAAIVAWLVHLTALSALSPVSCDHSTNWVAHLLTAITGAVTVAAMVACVGLRRRGLRAGDGDEVGPSLVFAGTFGLVMGAFSLALILYEGSWALWVAPCHP